MANPTVKDQLKDIAAIQSEGVHTLSFGEIKKQLSVPPGEMTEADIIDVLREEGWRPKYNRDVTTHDRNSVKWVPERYVDSSNWQDYEDVVEEANVLRQKLCRNIREMNLDRSVLTGCFVEEYESNEIYEDDKLETFLKNVSGLCDTLLKRLEHPQIELATIDEAVTLLKESQKQALDLNDRLYYIDILQNPSDYLAPRDRPGPQSEGSFPPHHSETFGE